MDLDDKSSDFFRLQNRLASFRVAPSSAVKKRTSTASSRAPKLGTWPHPSLAPADFAAAGFYFNYSAASPDNVTCFLCHKSLDGWEPSDDALTEHLKHSPECGWAVCAAIEARRGEYATTDPREPLLVEARKATFAGRWPYEGRKGWSCKTKQLVESGWKYTPIAESDDNVTCAYCELSLDGWEKADKPMDEHRRRNPDCLFFSLIDSLPAPKKASRSKAARTSKASRLSLQSIGTAMSDITSALDVTVDDTMENDASNLTVVTVKSTATAGGTKKKGGRAKKATGTTSRARKAKAAKDEVVNIHEDEAAKVVAVTESEPEATIEPEPSQVAAPKAKKGKKRDSSHLEDTALSVVVDGPPAPKKRATKKRVTTVSTAEAVAVVEVPVKRVSIVEDLQPAKPVEPKNLKNAKRASKQAKEADFVIFDPEPPEISEAEIEAELERLQAEVEMEAKAGVEAEVEVKPVKKRGRPSKKSLEEAAKLKARISETSLLNLSKAPTKQMAQPVQPASSLVDTLQVAEPTQRTATPPRTSLPKQSFQNPNQAAISPSPSPQASGAENQPPSSTQRPLPGSSTKQVIRQPLVVATPSRHNATPCAVNADEGDQTLKHLSSPNKSHKIGLQTTAAPWTPVDLDSLFHLPNGDRMEVDSENAALSNSNNITVGSDLTQAELGMTLEQWINANAEKAVEQLRRECEGMIMVFEREGGRALRVLEGVVVDGV